MTPAQKRAETIKRNQESKARLAQIRAEANQIVSTGKCPQCGRSLVRNLALTGWYQCEQYGAEGFRKDSSQPSCSFQCFAD